jgi:hypothetical protein
MCQLVRGAVPCGAGHGMVYKRARGVGGSDGSYTTGLFGKCMNGGCNNPAAMDGAFDRWFEGTNYQGGKCDLHPAALRESLADMQMCIC